MATKTKKKDIFKKAVIIISGLAFFWFSASAVLNMITNPQTPEGVGETGIENTAPNDQLQQEIEGYELVLENEPDNRFALERLVELNLQRGELDSALEPMEKLVELNPENEQYQEVLGIIEQGVEAQQNPQNLPLESESESEPSNGDENN